MNVKEYMDSFHALPREQMMTVGTTQPPYCRRVVYKTKISKVASLCVVSLLSPLEFVIAPRGHAKVVVVLVVSQKMRSDATTARSSKA